MYGYLTRAMGFDALTKEELARAYAFASQNVRGSIRQANLHIAEQGEASFQNPLLSGPMGAKGTLPETKMNLRFNPRSLDPHLPRNPATGFPMDQSTLPRI